MPLVSIPADQISNWDTFHDVFAEALGFPSYYGRNMDAWNDCLTSVDEESGMTKVVLPGSAFVNWRRIERGYRPIIPLSFYALIPRKDVPPLANG